MAAGGAFGLVILLRPCDGCQLPELEVVTIDHEFYSHVLIDQSDGSQVGVIQAGADWPAKQVQWHLKEG
jgi:hypothetical protein